jgi:hypothetical protein
MPQLPFLLSVKTYHNSLLKLSIKVRIIYKEVHQKTWLWIKHTNRKEFGKETLTRNEVIIEECRRSGGWHTKLNFHGKSTDVTFRYTDFYAHFFETFFEVSCDDKTVCRWQLRT